MSFDTVLVANRGEIACRVITACQELGLTAVAVYSEVDRQAPHVQLADRASYLGKAPPADSYLNVAALLEVARRSGAQALHPGYGFLSENGAFAAAVAAAGLTFIGPEPPVIELMGNKTAAKERMAAAGVPTIPGQVIPEDPDLAELAATAHEIGYPVMVKAAAGGGGKGMRIVAGPEELGAAVEGARREAQAAFGDGSLLLEKYLDRPRHIEFQVLGDSQGHLIHLFERECSIQRRYQKIIEEAPSTALTPELRQQMGQAAVTAARAVGYTNAGTVEFIFSDNKFYFLEMNTRLQVEHPITEATCGLDLVKWQLRIAAGEPLTLQQADIKPRGHAVECRIYAEDPAQDFLPAGGRLHTVKPPHGVNVRNDMGVESGSEVSTYYDPMLAKLIVWDETREGALAKMRWALDRYVVLGATTNLPFLKEVMAHPAFAAGDLTTHFIGDHFADYTYTGLDLPVEALLAAALADSVADQRAREGGAAATGAAAAAAAAGGREADAFTPWRRAGGWRIGRKRERKREG